jgi:hypothetical protein
MGTYVAHFGEGILGGLAGTAFMQGMMKLEPKMPEPLRGPELKGNPAEVVVSTAEKGIGTRIPEEARDKTLGALNWAYGAGWGAGLGLVSPLVGVRSFGKAAFAGAVMGTACWAVGYIGWLPAAGLVDPLPKQGVTRASSSFASHAIYGAITGVVMHAIDRFFAPRRGLYHVIFPRKFSLWGLAGELLS